jgi:ribosomal protein L11 methyltransferase
MTDLSQRPRYKVQQLLNFQGPPMDKFWIVTLFHVQPTPEDWSEVEALANTTLNALGIEEFSLDEPEVDALLGERSYSGGDLPQEVLDEVERRVLGRPGTFRFFFDNGASALTFKNEVSKILLGELVLEECLSQDWNAEWKKHYTPIKVNQHIEIIPSWMKPFQLTTTKQIYIYPGMGFGTGSHETTFLCLKLFTEEINPESPQTILDFGSGSGILGLSALKFSTDAKVDFYDIDKEANKNCDLNAELNDLQDAKFRLLLPEVRNMLQPSYDLVFANILESILMMEKDFLSSVLKPSGHLILSGLLRHQMDGIILAYGSTNLVLKKRIEKGDWGALLFTRGSH